MAKNKRIPTNDPGVNGSVVHKEPALHLNFAKVRLENGRAEIDRDVSNKGIAGVEINDENMLVVTLTEQPAGRPLVLCQDGTVFPGEEYREFRIAVNPDALRFGRLIFVAIYQ